VSVALGASLIHILCASSRRNWACCPFKPSIILITVSFVAMICAKHTPALRKTRGERLRTREDENILSSHSYRRLRVIPTRLPHSPGFFPSHILDIMSFITPHIALLVLVAFALLIAVLALVALARWRSWRAL
jgi:hypothetical protein